VGKARINRAAVRRLRRKRPGGWRVNSQRKNGGRKNGERKNSGRKTAIHRRIALTASLENILKTILRNSRTNRDAR
jgi:hypothetical protein